jgi:hypothetical protein
MKQGSHAANCLPGLGCQLPCDQARLLLLLPLPATGLLLHACCCCLLDLLDPKVVQQIPPPHPGYLKTIA